MGLRDKKNNVASAASLPEKGHSGEVERDDPGEATSKDQPVSQKGRTRPKGYVVVVRGETPFDISSRISVLHAAALLKTANRNASSPTPTTSPR